MAGNLALVSFPVTQESHRNRDSKSSAAHCFRHAKYTHVSQSLWRGLLDVANRWTPVLLLGAVVVEEAHNALPAHEDEEESEHGDREPVVTQ